MQTSLIKSPMGHVLLHVLILHDIYVCLNHDYNTKVGSKVMQLMLLRTTKGGFTEIFISNLQVLSFDR